jgi:hypothetical protein
MILLTLSEALPPDLIGAAISIIIDDKKKRQSHRVAKSYTFLPMKPPSTRSPAVMESRCRQPSPSRIEAKLSRMWLTVTPSAAYTLPRRGAFPEATQYSTRTTSVSDKNYASSVASKIISMRTGGGCESNRRRPAGLTWYIVRLRSAGHPRIRTV